MINSQSEKPIGPSKRMTTIFVLLAVTNIILNVDHGVIPAATTEIKASFNITDLQLGIQGSAVYAGIVTVGLFAGKIFQLVRARNLIIASYMGMMITLLLYTPKYPGNWPYFMCRYLTGASQASMLIYFPVWVDNFGQSSKTIWLTILQGGVPVGIFTGYVLTSIIASVYRWQYVFYLQVVLLFISFVCFMFVSSPDFDIQEKLAKIKNKKDLDASAGEQPPSYFQLIRGLLASRVWVCAAIAISVLFFTITGIQFWISDYMESVLNAPPVLVNTYFAIISITAPIMGCLFGGITTSMTGGYESDVSLQICFVNCCFACAAALPIPFIDTFWMVATLIWFLLFFGGALVPPLTGIMLTSVHPRLRAFANANNTMLYNLLGFLPAPLVYAALSTIGPRSGITFLMFYPLVGLLTITLAMLEKKRLQIRRDKLNREQISQNLVNSKGTHSLEVIVNPFDTVTRIKARSLNSLLKIENEQLTEKLMKYHFIPINQSIAASLQKDDLLNLFGKHDQHQPEDLVVNEEDEDQEYWQPTDL